MHEHNEILVALVGQPNSGKSTIFNYLTGLHQTIANYPGVTVTKKSGHYHDGKRRIEIVDLPGTYSLTSYSQEERVTRDFLLVERPEVVVAIVDAANLRRHLYFVFQLLELRIPLLVCLNMSDVARRRGIMIDIPQLEKELGVPVISTSGRTGQGLEELRTKINEISALHDHEPRSWKIDYGTAEPLIREFEEILAQKELLVKDFSPRWLAIKLLENDREARRIVQHHTHDKDWENLLDSCAEKIGEYEKSSGDSPRKTIAARRNDRAQEIEAAVVNRAVIHKRNSDTLDRFLCHPIVGLVGVALVMFLTFMLAFNISGEWNWIPWAALGEEGAEFEMVSPVGAFESLFEDWIPLALDKTLGLEDGDLKSLIYNGVVAGVGGVLVFVPVIFFIFLFISILNQCGYMARVIVVMDRIMRFFGLHGQSVLPMILGGGIVGGCAIPAVMATRTMREPKERLLTILVIPIMNCGAKLPVYALIIWAFFPSHRALIMTSIILISWTIALLVASVLGKTIIKGNSTPLIIELPTYQMPSVFEILATACRQSWMFIKKAGTIILAVNVLLWALMYYPNPENPEASNTERLSGSYAAKIGRTFEPVSQWAGFDWRDNIALIGGFAAKEVILSAFKTIYGIEEEDGEGEKFPDASAAEPANEREGRPEMETGLPDEQALVAESKADNEGDEVGDDGGDELEESDKVLGRRLQGESNWSPLKAFALLIFVMVYAPCFPTCIVIWKETGHVKFMLLAMAYTTILATILAIAVFQIGSIFGIA